MRCHFYSSTSAQSPPRLLSLQFPPIYTPINPALFHQLQFAPYHIISYSSNRIQLLFQFFHHQMAGKAMNMIISINALAFAMVTLLSIVLPAVNADDQMMPPSPAPAAGAGFSLSASAAVIGFSLLFSLFSLFRH